MIRLAVLSCNVSVESVGRLLDGGTLRLYNGRRPSLPNDPVDQGQLMLAELRFGIPAFAPPDGGVILAKKIQDAEAVRDGSVNWFRCETASGIGVLDGSFDDAEMDLRLNVRDVLRGARVSVMGLAIEQPVF